MVALQSDLSLYLSVVSPSTAGSFGIVSEGPAPNESEFQNLAMEVKENSGITSDGVEVNSTISAKKSEDTSERGDASWNDEYSESSSDEEEYWYQTITSEHEHQRILQVFLVRIVEVNDDGTLITFRVT